MLFTKQIFLFFLSNSSGQCYYLDGGGKVQTCQPGDPKSWITQAPQGWMDQQIGYGRNMRYMAMNRTYTQQLKFINDAATIIRWLYYQQRGPEEVLYLNVNKYNDTTDIYDPYTRGEVDLMNNVDDDVVSGITVNVIEGGITKLIKAYENTMFEIPIDGSIRENIAVNINGLVFNAIFNYQNVPFKVSNNGVIIPSAFIFKQGTDAGAIAADQTQQGFDPANRGAFNTLIATTSNIAFSFPRTLTNVQIIGTGLGFQGSCSNGALVAWTSLGNYYPLINTISFGGTGNIVPAGSITSGTTYNFNVTIPTLQAGENIIFMFITSDNTGTLNLSFLNQGISIQFNSQFQDSTIFGIRPYDLLRLLIEKICVDAYKYPEQKIYKLQSNLLKQHSNLVITSGMSLRKENGAVIKTSLAQFFESFDTELSACFGHGPVSASPNEQFFFEKLQYVFDTSKVSMDLGEIVKMKVKTATDLFFDVVKVGYPEQKYDEQQGNNEWNTTAQYKAPVRKISKEFRKISHYRGDPYGIEYTRVLVSTSNSTNNKSDNDCFILNIDYSNIMLAKAYANGTLGIYYGSGYFLPDAVQGTNRGLYTQFSNINGSGIASSFTIGQKQSVGDTLQYNGNNQSLQWVFNMQFEFRGDLSVHYYNNTNIFGSVSKKKEALPLGTYYAVFNLYYNGIVIYSQNLTLINGQSNQFTVAQTYLNYPFKFGDYIEAAIEYSSQDPRTPGGINQGTDADGYLLVFNVKTMSVVLTDSNSTPTYNVLKKTYDSSNLLNANQAYNIEEMSPVRILQKHGSYIKGVLINQQDKKLSFTTADKNKSLSTTLSGITTIDGADVPLANLPGNPLFYPYYFEFETKVPLTFVQILNQSANGHIRFTFNGKVFYGFPIDVKVKPALEDSQQWKLLCSPATNLSDLVDLEYNGINNIDLMNYGSSIPYLSPVKFVPLGYLPPAQYNFLHIDQDWFINQIGFWPFSGNYFQKWQQNDTIQLQCLTNGLAPVQVQVYSCPSNGTSSIVATFNLTQVNDPAIVLPNILWQGTYSLAALQPGTYYFVLTAGTGGTTTVWISEPQQVDVKWNNTLLFEYTSNRNRQATIFSTGYAPSFRVEGWLDDYMPQAKFATYEDQPADIELLNAIPYMSKMLNIGDLAGVPPWVIRLVDRIMLLSDVGVDGIKHTRDADAKWEKVDVPGWPMKYWKLQVREKRNRDAMTQTTAGDLNNNLTVAYNIDTSAFGDGAGNANVVQVTQVNS